MPVETSAVQLGQVTVGTMPTMNLKPHSGQSIFGMGCSVGGGGGPGEAAALPGTTPGAVG